MAESSDQVTEAPMQAEQDLSALLWLIAVGDHMAFHRLYQREGARLFAVALRITANEAQAEDALHEALMQIWRRNGQFRPGVGTPEGWLIAQVRQRSIELVRRRQRAGVPVDMFGRDADPACGLTRLAATQEARTIHDALAELDIHRREMMLLAYLDGLSSAELGQKMRLPVGTIKSWTRRSLATLSHAFGRPG